MRVVRLVEIDPLDLTAQPPDEPSEPTAEFQPEVVDIGPPLPDGVDLDEPPRGRRAAEVLRVRSSDMRLWRQAMPELFELTDAEKMQLELAGRLEEWTDSVAQVGDRSRGIDLQTNQVQPDVRNGDPDLPVKPAGHPPDDAGDESRFRRLKTQRHYLSGFFI